MVRGFKALDQRTVGARSLLDWRKDLLDDLGGETAVSAQQMALVEATVRTRLYVDHVDAWIMERGSLINARRRSVYPIIRERQQHVDSLARLLSALGLEPRPPRLEPPKNSGPFPSAPRSGSSTRTAKAIENQRTRGKTGGPYSPMLYGSSTPSA
jgi:hypothetical protein